MNCKKLPDNFVVIDVETTDFDEKRGGLLEIGAVDTAGRCFYRRVRFERGRWVEGGALAVNGVDALDLGEGIPITDALCDLFGWLRAGAKRWIMGGKNPQFDYAWLKEYWPKRVWRIGIDEVLSRRCIDLHSLAYGYAIELGIDMAAEDFTTDDIYKRLGLDKELSPHNALRGAEHEMEGFRRLMIEGVDRDLDPVFEAKMATMDRTWVQTVAEPFINNGVPQPGFMSSVIRKSENVEGAV